jgi:cytochrome c oxidase cbb3-type subunit 4
MIHAIWTIVLMVLFIGIVVWAWSGKRKARFDAAARLPFDEDPIVPTNNTSKENSHG